MKNLLFVFLFIGFTAYSQNIDDVKNEYKELKELQELINKRLSLLELDNPSLVPVQKDQTVDDFFKNSHNIVMKQADEIISTDVFERVENMQQQIMDSPITENINSIIIDKLQEYISNFEEVIPRLSKKSK